MITTPHRAEIIINLSSKDDLSAINCSLQKTVSNVFSDEQEREAHSIFQRIKYLYEKYGVFESVMWKEDRCGNAK